jgi:hypothetical protein
LTCGGILPTCRDTCEGGDENANYGDSDDLLYNTPIRRFGANTFFNSLFNLMSSYLSSESPLFKISRGEAPTIQTSYLGK